MLVSMFFSFFFWVVNSIGDDETSLCEAKVATAAISATEKGSAVGAASMGCENFVWLQ